MSLLILKSISEAIGKAAEEAKVNKAASEQPLPKGKGVDVANLVHTDIEARIAKGVQTYGERLTSHNGRDSLLDAYQESLDLAIYLRQCLYERDNQ